jgi:hypothetical protein
MEREKRMKERSISEEDGKEVLIQTSKAAAAKPWRPYLKRQAA